MSPLISIRLAGVMYVIAGLGYSAGKLVDGIVIDRFGPVKCFIIFQIVTVLGVSIFTFLNDVYHFSIILCINAFVQAGLWPALSKLFYEVFSPAQFACAFACLGISSRLGSAYSKAIIGYLLYLKYSWRTTIRIICALGFVGLIWFVLWMTLYLKDSDRVAFAYPQYNQIKQVLKSENKTHQKRVQYEIKNQLKVDPIDERIVDDHVALPNEDLDESHQIGPNDPQSMNTLREEVRYNQDTIFSQETLCQKLKRFFSNRRFLLICASNMFITMVVGLDAFSELLLSDVMQPSEPDLDTGVYVMVASSFPLGLTVALLVSYVFLRGKSLSALWSDLR